MDGVKPRAPLRLSVEERVDHAVQEAVRKALDEQRRTQERELDTLSDALQRSLAALAGERDRALRALAAEEEKRRNIVNEVSRLLGNELSAGDVSRIAMGLAGLEREIQADAEEDRDAPFGRAWLIEQLRQCLYARAGAQDHFRAATQQLADDRFDAEQFMGLGPAPLSPGDPSPHSVPIFPSSSTLPNAKSGARLGVALARAAASEALKSSLEMARERVAYLESLMKNMGGIAAEGGNDKRIRGRDVGGEGRERDGRVDGGPLGEGEGRTTQRGDIIAGGAGGEESCKHGVGDEAWEAQVGMDDGGKDSNLVAGGPTDSAIATAGGESPVEAGSLKRSQDEGQKPTTLAEEETGKCTADSTDSNGIKAMSGIVAERVETTAKEVGDENIDRPPPKIASNERAELPSSSRLDLARNDDFHGPDTVSSCGGGAKTPAGKVPAASATKSVSVGGGDSERLLAALEEANRWRMATRKAEAPLADLRERLGDMLALSFRCGEEHARQSLLEGDIRRCSATTDSSVSPGSGLRNDRADKTRGGDDDDNAVAINADGRGLSDQSQSSSDSRDDHALEQESGATGGDDGMDVPVASLTSDIARPALDHVRQSAGPGLQTEGGGTTGTWCGTGGACARGGGSCKSCEARAKTVHGLLGRLQTMSMEQAKDIARMDASLDILRHNKPAPHPTESSPKEPLTTTTGTPNNKHQQDQAFQQQSRLDGQAFVGDNSEASSKNRSSTDSALGTYRPEPTAKDGEKVNAEGSGENQSWSEETAASTEGKGGMPAASVRGLQDMRVGGGSGSVGGGRDSAGRGDVRTEWQELEGLDTAQYHSGGLGSPMVQGVLDLWIDVSKRRILEGWLAHVLHGGPVDAANGCFVPRVQISSLSKEVRDGLVSVVLPLLLHRRGVLLQVLTRERVELVHDIQIRVTPVAGRRDAPFKARSGGGLGGGVGGRRRAPVGEREHGARIRDMVMKAAHAGYVEEDEPGGGLDARVWSNPRASVDSLSRQLRDTWDSFNDNLAMMKGPRRVGGTGDGSLGGPLPEYG